MARSRPSQYGIAELALQELAGGLARELVGEVDRLRPLELGEPAGQVLHDRRRQLVAGLVAGSRLDHGLDLLAHVVVGDAEHGDVADARVGEDLALDLGRVDVHAPGDDHVALAVAEEQEAVLVEVADVADGEEPVGVVVLVGLGLVALVLEVLAAHLHPDGARAPRRRPALPSSSVIFSSEIGPRAADRARVLEPVLGGGGRAAALGGAVVLPDHRAPPVEHLLLHVDRARRGGVDRPAHRRHVVLGLHVLRAAAASGGTGSAPCGCGWRE